MYSRDGQRDYFGVHLINPLGHQIGSRLADPIGIILVRQALFDLSEYGRDDDEFGRVGLFEEGRKRLVQDNGSNSIDCKVGIQLVGCDFEQGRDTSALTYTVRTLIPKASTYPHWQ